MNPEVKRVYDDYPAEIRGRLLSLRDLILSTAEANEVVGPVTETLKWGEPAYLTEQSKSGSTIRLGWKASAPDQLAIYLNCRTTLVDTFRTLFPELRYDGSRAILFTANEPLPMASLERCFEMALTYHLRKTRRPAKRPSAEQRAAR